MELVGEIIKRKRESKKLTLKDISIELKISEEILFNIENNLELKHIDPIFIIGHLRSYCSYLELNHRDMIEQFKKENLTEENKNIELKKPTVEKNFLISNKVFSLTLIVLIFSTFYYLFINIEQPTREYAIIPDLPENYVSIIESANLNNFDIRNKKNDEKNFAKLENNFNSSSAIASLNNETEKSLQVTLKFLDDTWVQLRDENDDIILSQLMYKNDEYSYNLNLNYSITSGNAGHILVLIDKKVRGKIGKKGQVVDSLILDKDFNN